MSVPVVELRLSGLVPSSFTPLSHLLPGLDVCSLTCSLNLNGNDLPPLLPPSLSLCMCTCMCSCMCEEHRLTSGIFLNSLPPYFLRQRLSLNPDQLSSSGFVSWPEKPLVPTSLTLRLQKCTTKPGFYVSARHQNSGPCVA